MHVLNEMVSFQAWGIGAGVAAVVTAYLYFGKKTKLDEVPEPLFPEDLVVAEAEDVVQDTYLLYQVEEFRGDFPTDG